MGVLLALPFCWGGKRGYIDQCSLVPFVLDIPGDFWLLAELYLYLYHIRYPPTSTHSTRDCARMISKNEPGTESHHIDYTPHVDTYGLEIDFSIVNRAQNGYKIVRKSGLS